MGVLDLLEEFQDYISTWKGALFFLAGFLLVVIFHHAYVNNVNPSGGEVFKAPVWVDSEMRSLAQARGIDVSHYTIWVVDPCNGCVAYTDVVGHKIFLGGSLLVFQKPGEIAQVLEHELTHVWMGRWQWVVSFFFFGVCVFFLLSIFFLFVHGRSWKDVWYLCVLIVLACWVLAAKWVEVLPTLVSAEWDLFLRYALSCGIALCVAVVCGLRVWRFVDVYTLEKHWAKTIANLPKFWFVACTSDQFVLVEPDGSMRTTSGPVVARVCVPLSEHSAPSAMPGVEAANVSLVAVPVIEES